MQLRPYQEDARQRIYTAWQNPDVRNVMAVLPTGAGKCLGRDTPVLMFDGSIRPVQDIIPGDLLMGPDSTPRRVLSTCSGIEPLYRVTPTKGDPYVVNESHILSLRMTGTDEIVNIPVTEYLARSNYFKHCAKGWRTGVEFLGNHLPIPPYILGTWLGDGNSRSPEICNVDKEVVDEWCAYAESIGHTVTISDETRAPVYRIVAPTRAHGGNHVMSVLRYYGLILNKSIPHVYKTASRQQRLELLAGLIDTDGYLHHGYYDVVLKQKALADDTVYLARSLGLAAYVSPCTKMCTNTGATGEYWRISISGDVDMIPCRVPRRQASPRKQKKNVLNVGIKVTPIGEGDYYGFEIDGDRLFLLGDFTVTHNTVLFSSILHAHQGYSMSIAHRQELVTQISMSLAREGVSHRLFAPKNLIKFIINEHIRELGTTFYSSNAMCAVAGVDTLLRRADSIRPFLNNTTLWIQDEGHHVLRDNKWGKAAALMPNARGLAPTATPIRADGKGLGRHADGLMDAMVEGPSMRWLIDNGYLTDYRIFAPPSDLDLDHVDVSKVTGDYNPSKLKKAVQESHLVGDVVEHYIRIAYGKLGVTFATDVETATEISVKFNLSGVPAEVVSAKTPDHVRADVIRRFRNRELMQLVNVDLFGEGFDLPAIEVVSMARPTQSYSLYCQQFGRALRIMEGKDVAIIIDHAGNVVRHGLPDREREWSLDARGSVPRAKKPDDDIPLRYCPECTQPYPRTKPACPYCGHVVVPADRSRPEYVDGDLFELSPDVLAQMRAEVARASETPEQTANRMRYAGAPEAAVRSMLKKSGSARDARAALKESIAWWAGAQHALGRSDAESYRLFYHLFHVDVLTAQTLGSADTLELADRINHYLGGGYNG